MIGPKRGSRGHGPKRNTAQGRGGITRDTVKPAREKSPEPRTTSRGSEVSTAGSGKSKSSSTGKTSSSRPSSSWSANRPARSGTAAKPAGARKTDERKTTERKTTERKAGERNLNEYGPAERSTAERSTAGGSTAGGRPSRQGETRSFGSSTARKPTPRFGNKKPLPELKRIPLDAPAPDTIFVDRDQQQVSFPDSNLKRVAAKILSEKRKAWRYRPFAFPIFTDKGHEQGFNFDFYIYDAEDSVIRLILVVPFESREVWDKVGRFKRQYPMYEYELWTPEKLGRLLGPRGNLGF